MMNTLNAFVGHAASSLITRIERRPNLDELRHLYGECQEAIGLSSDGKKRRAELETKLAALVS